MGKKQTCLHSPISQRKVPHFTVSDFGSLAIDVGEFSSDRGCDLNQCLSLGKGKTSTQTPVSPVFREVQNVNLFGAVLKTYDPADSSRQHPFLEGDSKPVDKLMFQVTM